MYEGSATKQPQGTDNGTPADLWQAVRKNNHASEELYN
jgi:hypothetical protein